MGPPLSMVVPAVKGLASRPRITTAPTENESRDALAAIAGGRTLGEEHLVPLSSSILRNMPEEEGHNIPDKNTGGV